METLAARHRVMVTGVGMWTPLGGLEDTWQGLLAGRSGVRRVAADAPWSQLVGVAGLAELPRASAEEFPSKAHGAAYLAASQALADATLSRPARAGTELLVGNNATEMDSDAKLALLARACPNAGETDRSTRPYPPEFGLAWLRDRLGLAGVAPTLATNCVAGVQAIYLGASWIAQGHAKRVLAGGVDCAVTPEMAERFLSLHALASPPTLDSSRPFDARRNGFVLADGAGFLLLESESACQDSGARAYAQLGGWGFSNDAHHLTRSAPAPARKLQAMRGALAMAQVRPREIVALDAHGTSTRDNDLREYEAWRALFGDQLDELVITAAKSGLGHSLAGAGAIEAGLACRMLHEGQAPPIQNLEQPDERCPARGFERRSTALPEGPLLKTSFGFGGLNACGVFQPC